MALQAANINVDLADEIYNWAQDQAGPVIDWEDIKKKMHFKPNVVASAKARTLLFMQVRPHLLLGEPSVTRSQVKSF
jgi:hypothetical protein